MTNKKRKGFTIVELVIVIAVIAILAGVLIPTFASIIDKANQSADIQAVRQMNVLLKAESVIDKPIDVNKVIEIVGEAGYTDTKLTPKSKDHGFYWHIDTNTIVLVKDPANEQAELIYPLDNEELTAAFDTLKASWTTNGHAGFYDLADSTGTPATPTGAKIVDLNGLIEALTIGASKNYYLEPSNGKEILVNEIITATANVTIDLNGKELLIQGNPYDWSDYIISVKGQLTIIDNSVNKTGNINLDAYAFYGIYVEEGEEGEEGGHLILDGVNIIGNTEWSIGNYGKTEIQKSKFIVKYGHGIENADTTTITGGEFIAAGESVCSVYNSSGTMTIDETTFKKTTEVGVEVSYGYNSGPIEARGGELNLDNVNVTTGDTSDINVYCSGGANVNITEGLFKGKFNVSGSSSYIYISGGTKYNDDENDNFGKYTASEFKVNCCSGYVPDVGTQIRVIKCTYKVDNDKSETTFILHNGFYALDGLAGIEGFEGTNGLIIPAESVVVFDNSLESYSGSNRPETKLTQNIDIYGTLEINGGNLYARKQAQENINTITVFNNGTLVLDAYNYGVKYQSNSLSLYKFLNLGVVKDQSGNIITVSSEDIKTLTVTPKS